MMKKVLITAAALAIFSAVPAMAGEWKYNDVGWRYEYDNGSYASNGIVEVEGEKYCFDANGYMVTGWTWVNGAWHYCNSDGRMPAGCWIQDGGRWYRLNEDNSMRTGWYTEGNDQYYLYKAEDVYTMRNAVEGAMAVGTINIDGVSYFFNTQGDKLGKRVDKMGSRESNGIKFRYENGVSQWENINKRGEWIQFTSSEEMAFDLQEQLIERYENNHSYTSAREFEDDARKMLKDLISDEEIEDYINDTLTEQWGQSYRRKTSNDDD